MEPVAATIAPVVRLVKGLKDRYLFMKLAHDLEEGGGVLRNPRMANCPFWRSIAEAAARIAAHSFIADETIDLQPFVMKTLDELGIVLAPSTVIVQGTIV